MHPGNMKSLRNRSFCLYSMLLNAKLLRFSFKKMINGRISNKVRIFLGKLQHIIKSSPFLHFLILKCERCWEDMRGHDLRSLQGRWSPASRHPAPSNLQRANYIQPWPLVLLHQTSRICEKKKKKCTDRLSQRSDGGAAWSESKQWPWRSTCIAVLKLGSILQRLIIKWNCKDGVCCLETTFQNACLQM